MALAMGICGTAPQFTLDFLKTLGLQGKDAMIALRPLRMEAWIHAIAAWRAWRNTSE